MILVAIPAFNESKHIGQIVSEARQYSALTLVVDDGSRDDTKKLAEQAGALVIRHENNRGMGAAEETIMSYASVLMDDGDILVTLDGDGQHFPNDIPNLVRKLEGGYDVVNGSRLVRKDAPDLQPYRRILNGIATYVTRYLSGYYLTDSQSGFKAYRFWVVRRLSFTSKDYAWNSESYIRLKAMGARLSETPIWTVWTPPSPGHAKHALLYGVKVFGRLLLIRVGAL